VCIKKGRKKKRPERRGKEQRNLLSRAGEKKREGKSVGIITFAGRKKE